MKRNFVKSSGSYLMDNVKTKGKVKMNAVKLIVRIQKIEKIKDNDMAQWFVTEKPKLEELFRAFQLNLSFFVDKRELL